MKAKITEIILSYISHEITINKVIDRLCDLHVISKSDDEEMKEDCTYCENEREYYNSLLGGIMPCSFCSKTDNSQH